MYNSFTVNWRDCWLVVKHTYNCSKGKHSFTNLLFYIGHVFREFVEQITQYFPLLQSIYLHLYSVNQVADICNKKRQVNIICYWKEEIPLCVITFLLSIPPFSRITSVIDVRIPTFLLTYSRNESHENANVIEIEHPSIQITTIYYFRRSKRTQQNRTDVHQPVQLDVTNDRDNIEWAGSSSTRSITRNNNARS